MLFDMVNAIILAFSSITVTNDMSSLLSILILIKAQAVPLIHTLEMLILISVEIECELIVEITEKNHTVG